MVEPILPQFTNIDIASFPKRLERLLSSNLERIDCILSENTTFTWDTLMRPLEDMEDVLERLWSPVAHLHAVVNSKALRSCYEACLSHLSSYEAAIGHHQRLYEAIKSLDRSKLDAVQKKILEDIIQSFELSGVALPSNKKQRFEFIQKRLSELSNQFENHVLDATQAYTFHVTDAARVQGLPEHALHHAQTLAREAGLWGWVFNLETPCYLAVMTYADDRALRETLYQAYVTRASDEGPQAGMFDNTKIMNELLGLRHEKAQMLGFKQYAEFSLATKMAGSCEEVMHFLSDLNKRVYPQAQVEFEALEAFAYSFGGIEQIAPWDIAYFSEKKRQHEHGVSEEDLRLYFPLPKVMEGLFAIVKSLYGITIEALDQVDVWHADVSCYQLSDGDGCIRGYLYVDLFARPHKRGGAWMDTCQSRRKNIDGHIQVPIAMLTCNFTKPVGEKPAALSHDEVLTLFHEFGHALHHLLTKVDYLSVSGIHGVEWDAVELPSQFFENWCWEEHALGLLTSHQETGAALPKVLFERMLASKNFQSAMGMLRQLEFSLFDFRIHQEYRVNQPDYVKEILSDVRCTTSVVPMEPYNRFQHSFTHIFGGGYAAGYYSYKWAEVLSSDAFERFEEEGVLNPEIGQAFLRCILEVGGSKKAKEAFEAFRGRSAKIDALLRHQGILI